MRKRPWEIPVLTVLYLLAPVMNLGYTCVVRGYALTDIPAMALSLRPLEACVLLLYPLLAAAVWSVSKPGWWIFVAANAAILVHNVVLGLQVPGANPLVVVGAESVNVAVAALLFTKHARSPYFSPRARWWNQPVRYRLSEILEVPVTVRRGIFETRGQMLDVSENGCFVESEVVFDMDGTVELEFECWGLNFSAQGQVVRHTYEDGGKVGYGVLFDRPNRTQRQRLKALVRTLKAHRVPVRNTPKPGSA